MLPDDPSPAAKAYWARRDAMRQEEVWANYESRQRLAKKQYHVCPICSETLYNGEELHVHHITPKSKGGKDSYGNLVIVHDICHRQIHSLKTSPEMVRSRLNNLRRIMKERLAKGGKANDDQ